MTTLLDHVSSNFEEAAKLTNHPEGLVAQISGGRIIGLAEHESVILRTARRVEH